MFLLLFKFSVIFKIGRTGREIDYITVVIYDFIKVFNLKWPINSLNVEIK